MLHLNRLNPVGPLILPLYVSLDRQMLSRFMRPPALSPDGPEASALTSALLQLARPGNEAFRGATWRYTVLANTFALMIMPHPTSKVSPLNLLSCFRYLCLGELLCATYILVHHTRTSYTRTSCMYIIYVHHTHTSCMYIICVHHMCTSYMYSIHVHHACTSYMYIRFVLLTCSQ